MAEPIDPALLAYESIAPVYDDFTYRNNYEMWFGSLLPEFEKLGLRSGRLLDVACGTGRAFAPMVRRGWQIQACDISPAMVERAIAGAPDGVEIEVRDMRELPVYGEFELVWALNDAMNYLLGDGDLERAAAAMGANLAADGLLAFDCNTTKLFRDNFADAPSEVMSVEKWQWTGRGEVEPGIYESELTGAGVSPHVHRQRHWRVEEVRAALRTAGLEPLAALGQSEDASTVQLSTEAAEERDVKIIHVARRATAGA